jgi:secretion/DNA translocation related CpaE-like protein
MRERADDRRPDRPLLVTADAALLDDLLRLCGAAGVEAQVAHDELAARQAWDTAAVVVVGADLAPSVVRARVPRRPGVILVGHDLDEDAVWDLAVELGADGVTPLPGSQSWLVARLGDAGEGPAAAGVTVAVIGGRGGAGASTLAAAMSAVAADDGTSTMLLDVDPLGGGIDMLLGQEDAPGLRWPDLTTTAGRVNADSLRAALPRAGSLTFLSCGRDESHRLPVVAVSSVLAAARRSHELVVVDLARHVDDVAELVLSTANTTLLVVPAEVRATAAAGRVAAVTALLAADVRTVVRGPAPGGLSGTLVAEALGLPLAGWLDPEPDLARALEHGRAPAAGGKGPLATLCRSLLDEVLSAGHRAA